MSQGLVADVGLERDGFGLDLQLEAGADLTIGLVGPNGAGKSTLVEALAGLVPLSRGRVELGGRVLEDTNSGLRLPARERGIGVVFQDTRLFQHLSVLDNVAFGLVVTGVPRRSARARAAAWLERLGLETLARRRPGEISGGEAQRTALARALAPDPTLLLLDEPLSALDAERRPETRALLRGVLQACTCPRLIITHDPLDGLLLCDSLCVLEAGRVVQRGPVSLLASQPRSRYVASFVGLNLVPGILREREGRRLLQCPAGELVVADSTLPDGASALAAVHPRAIALSVQRPSSSARNALCGAIESLDVDADRVRVRLATAPALVAEITPEAARELDLRVGTPIWAVLKATEIDLFPS